MNEVISEIKTYILLNDIKHVCFDFDDTLMMTSTLHKIGYVKAFDILNLKFNELIFDKYIDIGIDKTCEMLMIEKNLIPKIKEIKTEMFEKIKYNCIENEKTKELLRFLRSNNISTSIISNASRKNITDILNYHDMIDCFLMIVSRDDVMKRKPSIDSMILLLEKLKFEKNNIIYIGNSENDENFANNCEVKYFGL